MISIGPEVISLENAPDKIPLGGALDSKDVKLSDGTRILKVTGYTPNDFTLSGILVPRGGVDSAIRQFERLERLAISHQPQRFVWTGDRVRRSFPVIVKDIKGDIQLHNEVAYTITLFRLSTTGEIAGGYVPTAAQRATQYSNGIRGAAPRTSGPTQSAISAMLAAQNARQHRGY